MKAILNQCSETRSEGNQRAPLKLQTSRLAPSCDSVSHPLLTLRQKGQITKTQDPSLPRNAFQQDRRVSNRPFSFRDWFGAGVSGLVSRIALATRCVMRGASKKQSRLSLAFANSCAAVVLTTATVGNVQAASTKFWAIDNFTTIQQLNGLNGAVLQAFPVPFIPPGGRAASIAVCSNVINNAVNYVGYYTILDNPNVYKVNIITHAYLGIAFTTGVPNGSQNSITFADNGNLWLAHGGNPNRLREFTTAGVLVSAHDFPTLAFGY